MNPFGKTYYAWVVGVAVLVILLALAIIRFHFMGLTPDEKVGVATLTPLLLLIVTFMELRRNIGLQRAAFIKDYVSQFFTNPYLYQTFHELIYTYANPLFNKVDNIKKEKGLDELPFEQRPIFDPFMELQGERQAGSRLYHPAVFQGSPEEKRLDALLGYFDVVGYYRKEGYLRTEDIAGSIGYFLAVMSARRVIHDYLELNRKTWEDEINSTTGVTSVWATPPFAYLRDLLDQIESYNERVEKKNRKQQQKKRDGKNVPPSSGEVT